jgi:hypothetical protein
LKDRKEIFHILSIKIHKRKTMVEKEKKEEEFFNQREKKKER